MLIELGIFALIVIVCFYAYEKYREQKIKNDKAEGRM